MCSLTTDTVTVCACAFGAKYGLFFSIDEARRRHMMKSESDLKFTRATLGVAMLKLSRALIFLDLFILLIFFLEGTMLEYWIYPILVLGLSLGIRMMGTSLNKRE